MKDNKKGTTAKPSSDAKPKSTNLTIIDWINVGVAFTSLSVTSIWSFVLTAQSVNANITVQAMLIGAGMLLNYFSINAIGKVIKK